MTAVPSNIHLLDSRGCLNVSDYAALCWPVLERLTAAVLVSGLNAAEIGKQHVVVSPQWTDEI